MVGSCHNNDIITTWALGSVQFVGIRLQFETIIILLKRIKGTVDLWSHLEYLEIPFDGLNKWLTDTDSRAMVQVFSLER